MFYLPSFLKQTQQYQGQGDIDSKIYDNCGMYKEAEVPDEAEGVESYEHLGKHFIMC